MEGEELALALDAVEGRVPLHGLAHVGHVPHDERVESTPDVALPARHGRDVSCTGASPSAFAIWGLPPARSFGFAATRLAAVFLLTFADFLDVLLATVFTPCCVTRCATWWHARNPGRARAATGSWDPREQVDELPAHHLPAVARAGEVLVLVRLEARLHEGQARARGCGRERTAAGAAASNFCGIIPLHAEEGRTRWKMPASEWLSTPV